MIGPLERRLPQNLVLAPHGGQQPHGVNAPRPESQRDASQADEQRKTESPGPNSCLRPALFVAFASDPSLSESGRRLVSRHATSRSWGPNLPNRGYGTWRLQLLPWNWRSFHMKTEFFRGRRWLAALSIATALAVTGFYGLRAAELGKLPFENPAPTIKTAARSEAAAGRGYSAVVKRVVPAVVNISILESGETNGDGDAGGRGSVLPAVLRQRLRARIQHAAGAKRESSWIGRDHQLPKATS